MPVLSCSFLLRFFATLTVIRRKGQSSRKERSQMGVAASLVQMSKLFHQGWSLWAIAPFGRCRPTSAKNIKINAKINQIKERLMRWTRFSFSDLQPPPRNRQNRQKQPPTGGWCLAQRSCVEHCLLGYRSICSEETEN